jgi:cytochrome P450/ferredoxin-NADP reductase
MNNPNIPVYPEDVYSDTFILDPYPRYREMRELGPVIWLEQHGVYAVARYDEVTQVLRNHETFISGKGLSLNQKTNDKLVGSTLNSDSPAHERTRAITGAPLLPGALTDIEPRIRQAAENLIDELAARGSFDAVADLAQYLPLTIVAEMVGLPSGGRDNMLRWASATFNLFGPENQRALECQEDLKDLFAFLDENGRPEKLKEGGWAKRIFEVGEKEGIPFETCAQLMRDYINPSLDTTISATAQAIKFLADSPEQWETLRREPDLIPNAVEESVRLASPIRAFSRYVAKDTELAGTPLEAGSRILVFYASANRDERKYSEPDRFDARRDVHNHVGFGHGIHMCMGMHLARLEMVSLLQALARRVSRFELTGTPSVAMNNTIRAYASLPVRVEVDHLDDDEITHALHDGDHYWQEVTIAARRQEAEDILSFELVPRQGQHLPSFAAGAHVDVNVADGITRQYSLANDPRESSHYRIGVLREAASRGGSERIHASWQEGDTVRISQPRNHFPLEPGAPHYVLLAGGIGITPLLAMAYRLQFEGASFELHYCARSLARMGFCDELAMFGERIHWHADDGPEESRFDIQSILDAAPEGTRFYTCGPGGFIDFVEERAMAGGKPRSHVHFERFGAEIDTDGESFEVIARHSGVTVVVEPGETIAEKLIEQDVPVNMSCQSGVCGTCLTPVLEGTPDHRDLFLTDKEKSRNESMTICCSRSQTRTLVLDI